MKARCLYRATSPNRIKSVAMKGARWPTTQAIRLCRECKMQILEEAQEIDRFVTCNHLMLMTSCTGWGGRNSRWVRVLSSYGSREVQLVYFLRLSSMLTCVLIERAHPEVKKSSTRT